MSIYAIISLSDLGVWYEALTTGADAQCAIRGRSLESQIGDNRRN